METKRIEYMDALRGLAIFLMVMGHVLAWIYTDYKQAFESNLYCGFLWKFIYSFHMPLFVFVSGYFFVLKFNGNISKESAIFICKKFVALLIPFVTMGFLLRVVRDNGVEYWFLRSLFELFVLCLPLYLLSNFITGKLKYINKTGGLLIDFLLFALGFAVFFVVFGSLNPELKTIFDTESLKRLYPYFIFGLLLRKYDLLQKIISKNIVYSLSLIIFLTLFFVSTFGYLNGFGFLLTVTIGFPAIFVLYYFFKNSLNEGRSFKVFSLLGKRSIEIYLIHFFFAFKLTELGEYLAGITFYGTSLLIQIVYSTVVSIIIIAISLGIANVISSSKILSFMLLGKMFKLI